MLFVFTPFIPFVPFESVGAVSTAVAIVNGGGVKRVQVEVSRELLT